MQNKPKSDNPLKSGFFVIPNDSFEMYPLYIKPKKSPKKGSQVQNNFN